MPNSSSSTLIWRRSIARTVPSLIGSSYVLPVRLSVTERDSEPMPALILSASARRQLRDRQRLEVGHRVQLGKALLDLIAGQRGDSLGAELLDVEGGEHGAVSHCAAQAGLVELAVLAVEVADEAAGEAVAGPGRVAHLLQREAGQGEE